MGSYLCRSEAPAAAARPRPSPALAARPSPIKRLSLGAESPSRYALPRRRYPIRQPQHAALGSLPAGPWDGGRRKSVLASRNGGAARSPVTVKIAPPDAGLARSRLIARLLAPLPTSAPDPCARETVLNAIKERRRRGGGGEEEDAAAAAAAGGQESKRRRRDSSGSGQSAFESLAAGGAPAALVPKPGSLKRAWNAQPPDDPLRKRSRASSSSSLGSARGIPSSARNAIASSYSSSRGLRPSRARSVAASSSPSSSSRSRTPEKEEEPQPPPSLPPAKAAAPQSPPGRDITETPVLKKPVSFRNSSPEGGGKRRRRIPLLPSWRGDPLALPPPPQLGRSVTAEDLDAEKRLAIQRLNKALEEKSHDTPSSPIETTAPGPSLAFTPATTAALASPTSSAGSNPLLDSLTHLQKPPGSTEPAGGATQMPPLSSSAFSAASLTVGPSSSAAVLASPAVSSVPSSSELASDTSLRMPAIHPSETPDAKLPSASSPKRGILFGMLSGTTPNSTIVATPPAGTAAAPTFKHIFGAPLKVENAASPLVSLSEACSTPPPSSVMGAASSTTFKPIFGTLTATTNSSTVISPFTFNQTPVTSVTPAATSTTSSSMHSGLISAVSTTSSAFGTITTQRTSSSIDSSAKPSFTFGLSSVPSTTTSTTTGAHSFQFGALSNPTASTATGFGAGFQFNKQPVATTISSPASQATSIFDQTPSLGTKAAFSIFGSTPAAAAATTTTSSSQPTLTFGSSSSAFSALPFGTSANAPPPYPGITSQPTFSNSIADAQPVGTKPATDSLNFSTSGAPFSFGMSTVQSAFGNAAQPHFPENSSQSSFSASSTQPTFGNTTSAFGTVALTTAPSFGSASTQTTTSSASGPLFGGTPAFTFGASNQSGSSSSTFNIGAQNSNVSSATSGFGFGAGQNQPANATAAFRTGVQSSSATPVMNRFSFGMGQGGSGSSTGTFGSPALQSNAMSNQNQSALFSFGTPVAAENKLSFGGTSIPTFGQNTSATPVAGGLSFGTSSTPGSGFATPGPFGSSTPAFSIGLGSKPPGTRQRLQARRQHVRKKQL
uniref:Nuclear envelope pore membrane protein POM 121-like n=1 Tax=Geotrypetes seraphini TaxID=260995 RepID=A0A6P8NTX4_GEOSA|nr:nuclear envelope pore membrane protein POM 121-like [Geotrypetes seraphini]